MPAITNLPLLFQAPAAGGGWEGMLLMVGAMFVVLYFFMIRPQQKRQKEHQSMLSSITTGDRVTTSSGMIGTVRGADDQTFTIEIAPNTHVKFQKAAITGKADSDYNTGKK
jgi:preprotein translocase subunit YajC